MNLGDCFAYALAKTTGLPLMFKGDDFAQTDITPAMPQLIRDVSAGFRDGIGNLLRHEYGRIDDRIMWRVVQKYLPELKGVVLDMLRLQRPPKPRR